MDIRVIESCCFTDDIIQGIGYFGITPGISDPSVFDVPSICKSALEQQVNVTR